MGHPTNRLGLRWDVPDWCALFDPSSFPICGVPSHDGGVFKRPPFVICVVTSERSFVLSDRCLIFFVRLVIRLRSVAGATVVLKDAVPAGYAATRPASSWLVHVHSTGDFRS